MLQSRGVKSRVVPLWLTVQLSFGAAGALPSKPVRKIACAVCGLAHSAGGFFASSGWKLHCVGGLRISTATRALATWAQSELVMTSPDGAPVVSDLRLAPTRSAQDCSSASA